MPSRAASLLALSLFVAVPAAVLADEPQGRGRTWELGADLGAAYLDGGFNSDFLGYRVASSNRVPPTFPDKPDSTVAGLGLRAGFNFVRYFGLELNAFSGSTEVGTDTDFILRENFALEPTIRRQRLAEQTAAVPGIRSSIESLDFDYASGSLAGVFSFNNRPTTRWVWYVTLGGGVLSLNPDTAAYNNCLGGNDAVIRNDPNASVYNGDPNAIVNPDLFPDNPERIRIDPRCGRAFPIATTVGATQTGTPIVVLGTRFEDSDALLEQELPPNHPLRMDPGFSVDPTTNQVFVNGLPQWASVSQQTGQIIPGPSPGTLRERGFRTTGPVRGITEPYYLAGAGVRWHFRPRQLVRIDFRRAFAETINKNVNQFTVGYSFVVGKGKPDRAPLDVPEPEVPEPEEEAPAEESVPETDEPPARG